MMEKVPTEIVYVAVAAFGGIARYLQFYLMEGAFAWRHFIAHVLVSCFSGYMFFQFATDVLGLGNDVIPVIAGMGGWMGVEALKLLESTIKKKWFSQK